MISEKNSWHGFYRAKVTETDIEDNDYGAIRVFVPDLMTDLDPNFDEEAMGLIAYPANNPLGGRNDLDTEERSFYQGTVIVPPKGTWVWVFFEGGNPHRPFYWNSFDFRQAKLPPENRIGQLGDVLDEPHRVYTILKSHTGRCIVVCDSEDYQRVEITGKKRQLGGADPSGEETEKESTYVIDDNQTTILLDERDGKEKLLIRTHKGDYLHIDIDEQRLQAYFADDIRLQTGGNLHISVGKDMHLKVDGSIYDRAELNRHISSGINTKIKSGGVCHVRASGIIAMDGSFTYTQSGRSTEAIDSSPILPEGERDT